MGLLWDVDIDLGTILIVTSDNFCSQYKSSKHFFDLQKICNEYQISLICFYDVAVYGKNEMDAVGRVAKIAVHTAIFQVQSFFNAEDCISYLSDKFNYQENPS